jgi:GntR family transcriptional regulator
MMVYPLSELKLQVSRYLRPGVPKYAALKDAMLNSITSGEWPPQTRLPNEPDLAAAVGLSLGTVQRALRMLADDGALVRNPGQGTFVAQRSSGQMNEPLHCRFVDDTGSQFMPIFATVTARYPVDQAGPWQRHLGVMPLLCVERVISIGGEFNVFSRFYVDARTIPSFADLPSEELSVQNFKEIIWRETGQPIGRLCHYLSSLQLDAELAAQIACAEGTRGQLLEVSAFSWRNVPVYYQELYIPDNRRKLYIVSDGREPDPFALR